MRALSILLVLLSSAGLAQERSFHREYPVEAGARFSLESFKGTIHIRTGPGAVVVADARIYPDQGEDPELVELVEIRERSGARHVSLEVEHRDPEHGWSGIFGGSRTLPMVDWEITLPDDASLQIDTHKGVLEVDAPAGRVEISSHKGSGTVRGVRGELQLDTHKGDFEIDVVRLDDLRVDTHKGDVAVTVHGATDFEVRGDSHNGELRFSGRDIPVSREDGETVVDYRSGDGRHRIELSTHKGTIRISFEE